MRAKPRDLARSPHSRAVVAITLGVCLLVALGGGSASAATAWKWSKPSTIRGLTGAVNGLSCPSASLCVAVSGTEVFWSTDPRGGGSTWKKATLPRALDAEGQPYVVDGVSCPSTSFCVAIDQFGNTYTSTDPTGGEGAWTLAEIDFQTYPSLESVSCASAALCGVLDITGDALTSASPGDTPATWGSARIKNVTASELNGQPEHDSISCVAGSASSLCAAVEGTREVAVSADPGTAQPAWSVTKIVNKTLNSLSCASASLCVAGANSGQLLVSRNPAVAGSWKSTTIPSQRSRNFEIVSCDSASVCLAITEFGEGVLLSTDPLAKGSAWHSQGHIDIGSITAASCTSKTLCFIGDSIDQVAVGRG
jgi:hypothetical protein